jgi:hypothetical protein
MDTDRDHRPSSASGRIRTDLPRSGSLPEATDGGELLRAPFRAHSRAIAKVNRARMSALQMAWWHCAGCPWRGASGQAELAEPRFKSCQSWGRIPQQRRRQLSCRCWQCMTVLEPVSGRARVEKDEGVGMNSKGRWQSSWWFVLALLSVGTGLVLLVALVMPTLIVTSASVPDTAGRLKLQNDVRATLLQAVAGILFLVTAFVAWRQLQISQEQLNARYEELSQVAESNARQLHVTYEQQITDRFARAVDQLGSDNVQLRLGALHSLGRLALNSTHDREAIYAMLASFVASRASWSPHPAGSRRTKPRTTITTLWISGIQTRSEFLSRRSC